MQETSFDEEVRTVTHNSKNNSMSNMNSTLELQQPRVNIQRQKSFGIFVWSLEMYWLLKARVKCMNFSIQNIDFLTNTRVQQTLNKRQAHDVEDAGLAASRRAIL